MLIALFISIIQIILFLGHFIVYKTVVRFLHITNPGPLLWTRIIFIVLSLSFIAASSIAFRFYGPVVRAFYIPAAIWLGTLYWLVIASVVAWILHSAIKSSSLNINTSYIAISLLVIALLVSAYGVWNSYQTKVREVTITIEGLPEQWKGKKAVLVADTHLGNIRNVKFSLKAADLISKQKPDIVFIPGDFYDGTPENFRKLAEAFGKITSTYGVFMAPGNHEEFGDSSPFLEGLREAGVTVLDNEKKTVEGLQIVGVNFSNTVTAEGQHTVLEQLDLDPNIPSILIKHAPTLIDSAERAGVDLQVSAHTHLGQVWPLRYITKAIYGKFHYGLQKLNSTQVYTTSGIGTWGPPQRVGTNSEIIVITLQ